MNLEKISNIFMSLFKNKLLFFFIIFLVFVSFFSPYFFNVINMRGLLYDTTILALIMIGEGLVILIQDYDLSIGGIISLTGVVLSTTMVSFSQIYSPFISILLSILISLIIGIIFGFFHGFVVSKVKLPSFIVTLGGMGIASGIAQIISEQKPVILKYSLNSIIRGNIFKIPIVFIVLIIIFIVLNKILRDTPLGRSLYAIGGNEKSAVQAGIKVDNIRIGTYIASGILSAIAGILLAAEVNTGYWNIGDPYTFEAFTGVLLAGIYFGKGNFLNLLISALLLTAVDKEIVFLGINPYIGRGLIGILLILLVYFKDKK